MSLTRKSFYLLGLNPVHPGCNPLLFSRFCIWRREEALCGQVRQRLQEIAIQQLLYRDLQVVCPRARKAGSATRNKDRQDLSDVQARAML